MKPSLAAACGTIALLAGAVLAPAVAATAAPGASVPGTTTSAAAVPATPSSLAGPGRVTTAGPLTAPASAARTLDAARHSRFLAVITPVDRWTRASMVGVSWEEGCPVPISDLRVIYMTHRGFDGRTHVGRLMVHRDVAVDVARVFGTLYDHRFPIRRMDLIERYDADDDASMAADNTSAFNCRPITGTTDRFSIHSYGKAIDINTIENPYVKGTLVLPPAGADYLDRTDVRPGMVTADDLAVRSFAAKGFTWGGDYTSLKDYQHFEIAQP